MGSKVFRFLLIGFGVVVLISGLTNLMTAAVLIEPGDEAAMGLSHSTMVLMYAVCILAGAGLIYMGMRKKK